MSAESTERTELLPTRLTLLERLKDLDDQESWKDFFTTYSGLVYGVAVKAVNRAIDAATGDHPITRFDG